MCLILRDLFAVELISVLGSPRIFVAHERGGLVAPKCRSRRTSLVWLVRACGCMSYLSSRITRQGFPTATLLAGIFLTTRLAAPMTELSPMLTPGQMTQRPPSQTFSPMVPVLQTPVPGDESPDLA